MCAFFIGPFYYCLSFAFYLLPAQFHFFLFSFFLAAAFPSAGIIVGLFLVFQASCLSDHPFCSSSPSTFCMHTHPFCPWLNSLLCFLPSFSLFLPSRGNQCAHACLVGFVCFFVLKKERNHRNFWGICDRPHGNVTGHIPIASACPGCRWPCWMRFSMPPDLAVDLSGAWGALGAWGVCQAKPPHGTSGPMQTGRGRHVDVVTAFSPWDSSCKSFPDVVKAVGLLNIAADHWPGWGHSL